MTFSDRLVSLVRFTESHMANQAMTTVLRSPLHPLLSWQFILLSYEGRKSGRRYTTPVLYWQSDDGLVLLTPADRTNWWRNFRGEYSLKVLLQGNWRTGWGEVDADEEHVFNHFRRLVDPIRKVSYVLFGRHLPSNDYLRQIGSRFILVRVALDEDERAGRHSDR